jgi:hypothetical protein
MTMSEEKHVIPRDLMVDRFIEVANEFTRTEAKERVGAAIMFAAARYNAFEASSKSKSLVNDKDDALSWYTAEYRRMLQSNMEELIKLQS